MNKKKMTFFIYFALIVAFSAISLAAVPSAEAAFKPGERAIRIWNENLNPSKQPVFLKFKASMETGDGREESVTTMAMKDRRVYVDVLSDMRHISTITDNTAKTTVILMHEEKMYVKMPHQESEGPKINEGKKISEAEKAKMAKSSGKEKIAGKTYDYDRIIVNGNISQTYYFEEGTDKWKYWRTDETLMEIIEYGGRVDDALFRIPKGYTKMDM